ncbi:MAG: hypothetical protein IMZ66_12430 [Planctomycetes bacterium]|nr:hypothetical protein [Planctomycetota bacterium]
MQTDSAAEVFITATPDEALTAAGQAEVFFPAIRDVLRGQGARILQERVFATEEAFAELLPVRTAAYGDLDDGVPPVLLCVPAGAMGPLVGVQVHAVSCDDKPSVILSEGQPRGRSIGVGGARYIAFSGLVAPEAGSASDQARSVFEKAASALRAAGGTMLNVARTWLWLGDILAWYDDFNKVRNRFFQDSGLLNAERHERHLPASTGIGIGPAGGPRCALDFIAVMGDGAAVECYRAAGMQQSAFNYGSAFSRVASATTPAGKTVYVSGTAAIDEAGKTCHVGDAAGQIAMTLANVRAAMRDMGCSDADVVHSIAYSKTPEIEALFRRQWADLGWPCISAISDVCRDDLLFEVEAAACPGAKSI